MLEVNVAEDADWQLYSLPPLPWATLDLLLEDRAQAIKEKWKQAHGVFKGRWIVNVSEFSEQTEAVELQVAGIDVTRCTAHVEVHSQARRLPEHVVDARRALLAASLKSTKGTPGPGGQPPSLVVVVMDSVPSPAWDIFAPKTLQELEQVQGSSSHEAFRFHGYHAYVDPECDCLTQDNMISFFSGRRAPKASQSRRVTQTASSAARELQDALWLWQEFVKHGYATLSADDSCSRSVLNVMDPGYDFFDAYGPTWARGIGQCAEEVFCRFPELFNYTADWLDLHADLPRMAYLHLDGTHGTRPEALLRYDDDIASFVSKVLRGKGGENTIVVLMSDHGVQSGDGHLTGQPFLGTWIPRSLLEALGESATAALRYNSARLMTPQDVHFTLQQLLHAGLQAARGDSAVLSDKTASRQPLGKVPIEQQTVRSALWPLPVARSCEDAGLDSSFCFCAGVSEPNDRSKVPLRRSSWQGLSGFRMGKTRRAGEAHRLATELVDLVNARARRSLLTNKVDLSICKLQKLAALEAVRVRDNGTLVELVVSTEPFGLIWKGIARPGGVVGRGDLERCGSRHSGSDCRAQRVEIASAEQITRYFPHEHCTPAGIDPKFCACNHKVVHRLAPHERFWTRWPK
eukprot:TRINITY_DN50964_c0_g1_i1.p1 TRINITY_DN50964_c0_g1~~TRINITY_DN50964_c0_g1_i1.p1  ORF type:complete len:631 (+),score=120.35 TRINITY_DN50964_c0_g1_i1:1481-3373(+)